MFINSLRSQSQTPPSIIATGSQAYCPLSQQKIVTDFDISNPDNIEIEAIHIQISTGYVRGEDLLKLIGSHPTIIVSSFNTQEGKLTLTAQNTGLVGLNELIAATKDVVFENSSATLSGEKYFSFTLGNANYLPITGHFYEYVSYLGISWTDAKIAAEGRVNAYGFQGYLATITYPEEAALTGEQAIGTGWIGGSDAATEGVWKWVTGPENGTIFWNGLADGSSPANMYSNWNTGEPNNQYNEDYAHVTAPNVGILGSWNDLPLAGGGGDYEPKGYLVEYGGMPGDPNVDITASTKIFVPSISTTSANSCGPGTVILSATATQGTVLWYDAQTGGTLVWSGSNFTTPTLSTSKTYYAFASVNGCLKGNRTPATATIFQIPTIDTATDVTICGPGSATLNVTASEGLVNWYNNPTGGSSINTGNTFNISSITTTTTYYVDATENVCTTKLRVPITLYVHYTPLPTALISQSFCDLENARIADLAISGSAVLWYNSAIGGTPLNGDEILINDTIYYASQTLNDCESITRLAVEVRVYETVNPPQFIDIPIIQACDTANDGDDTNGFTIFDLTLNNNILLNGKSSDDFTFSYFKESNYSSTSEIFNPTSFENTITNGQTIYVLISNNLDITCFTESSFSLRVDALPIIQTTVTYKNCDEDGVPDGFTDYNLDEINDAITVGSNNLMVTYHLTLAEANNPSSIPLNPSPFNNRDAIVANTVYARVENEFGCHRVSTITLQVSTTTFSPDYMQILEFCDDDDTADGLRLFDLTQSSDNILNDLPVQNLSVHYYRNQIDAQLEQNEILPQSAYMSEVPFSQTLYVRVENEDNGDCWGIGPHLTLIVRPRPEFDLISTAIVCLNLPPIVVEISNPQGLYSYEWINENGTVISNDSSTLISKGGTYTVIATSSLNCESFPYSVIVTESIDPDIGFDDITIVDDSTNNSIAIDNENNNLGIGDYEFSLDDSFGPYQDDPFFEMVASGVHTIYVRDKNECGMASIDVSVIGYPKFFSPNNDGINDTWQVKGVNEDFYPTSLIYIFNRYGKILTQIDPTGLGWNGLLNGKSLPASDYWFTVQLIDKNGNTREKTGHFSLVR